MGNSFTKNNKCPDDYDTENYQKIKDLYQNMNTKNDNIPCETLDPLADNHFIDKIQILEHKKELQIKNYEEQIEKIQLQAENKLIDDLTHANNVHKMCLETINNEINELKALHPNEKRILLKKEISKFDNKKIHFKDFFKYMQERIKYTPN